MTDDAAALVRAATAWLADAVEPSPASAWDARAGALDWTCRRTADHLLDDLVAYALQLCAARDGRSAQDDYLPVVPPRGGDDLVAVDPTAGTGAVASVLRAFGELFASVLDSTAADVRAFHPWGLADRTGFAAIGLVEILVHGHDILLGLGLPAMPPPGPCAFVVARAFPDAPDGDPREVLLWCTGRSALELPDGAVLERVSRWRPDASVRG